jgi:3-dehydroquinate synthase
MSRQITCTPPAGDRSYVIEIQHGSLKLQAAYLASLAPRIAIITDDVVADLYGQQLQKQLQQHKLEAHLFTFPPGEQHKTRTTKEALENQLFEKGLGRDTAVIALGGGITTDMAGFLAATYCRGLPLVMVPTSLLGMVDASIGGKTGVDVPYGKNLLGAIYQPKRVVIDPATLVSLPKREFANGMVEMIKHGLIANSEFLHYLETHVQALKNLDSEGIERAIFESCMIKKAIVEQDETEQGKRRLLNFGHTIGHALETLSTYQLAHGEAVAIGLLVESYFSMRLGLLDGASLIRIKALLQQYGLPLKLPAHYSPQAMLDAMAMDKKSTKGKPRFVVLEAIGSSAECEGHYCMAMEEKLLIDGLQWMNDDLCRH